jgi:hypothetical protein
MTDKVRKIEAKMNLVFPNLRTHIANDGSRPAAAAFFFSSSHNLCNRSALYFDYKKNGVFFK